MLKKLLFILVVFPNALLSQTVYVDQNATGANNGTDWVNAYTNLQTAITNIGTNTTINVAQGTYYTTTTTDRTISFSIPVGIKMFGGFPTGGGNRNPELYETILSGDIGTTGVDTDNSYHVVYFNSSSTTNEFDGFTVEGGYADGTSPDNDGAGINIQNTDTGAYNFTIKNCVIRNNWAANNGGGILINTIVEIYNCKIYSNYAGSSGGGVHDHTDGRIYNSLIVNNSSGNMGGGISLTGFNSAPQAINCIIANNEAVTNGAGADLYRGLLINCTVVNNEGPDGVHKYTSSTGGGVRNSIIWGNTGNQTSRALEDGWDYNCAVQGITDYGTYIGLSNNNEGNLTGINYPRFTNPTSFTGNAITQAQLDEILNANWYINPQSAAINFGDNSKYPTDSRYPTVDIVGNNRTINTTMDAGAYEALTNIVTTQASNQAPTSADLNGEILFAETTNTVTRGFVYATIANFDVTTATSVTNSGTGLGVYTDNITGLTEDQMYYYRTWVQFDGVKYYGNEVSFKASNLVAYYPFNGNANDESGSENNGTVHGATLTTDRFGNSNSAYYFDGTNNYIQCTTEVGPFGADSRTISFWAKTDVVPNPSSQQNAILSYGGNVSVGGSRFEILINPKCRGLGIDTSTNYITKEFDNSDNGWHKYTIVLDNTISSKLSDIKFFADGNLLGTVCNTNGDLNINTLDEQVLNIGRLFYSGDPRYFKGAIDEIKIYNKALTDVEVSTLYTNETLAVTTEKLATNLKFYVNNNTLNFKNSQNLSDIKNIAVFNMLGQKVYQTDIITNKILFNSLKTGVYILKVENKNSNYNTLKFIIY
jgi:hypothetical protein